MKTDLKRLARPAVALIVLAALGGIAACSDNPGDPCSTCPPPPQGVIVSDPVPSTALAADTRAALAAAPGAATDVVYVSLAPGTAPGGNQAVVRRVGDAASLTTAVTDGGFDPVPVPAQTGDSIDVVVTDNRGTVVLQQRVLVVAARPPVVVRTDPPPKKRDVPLNASMVIVFNEPINSSTLGASSVQLVQGTNALPGRVAKLAGSATTVAFTPTEALIANTDYELVITQDIQDLDGDHLQADVIVDFATGPAVVSPGSGQIAFVSGRDGNNEIYVMNADGSSPINLTNDPASDVQPAWSPDGSKIAFTSFRDGNDEIYVMNADGSGLLNLTKDPANDGDPTWSPDGSSIAFASDRDGNWNTHVMSADGSHVTLMGSSGLYPAAWSPDGTRIAYVQFVSCGSRCIPPNAYIWVAIADGSGATQLTNGRADAEPAWSPDGTRIAFRSLRGSSYEIAIMNADGSGQMSLTDSTGNDHLPVWSPDGSRIAFFSRRSGNAEVYVMNADGSGLRRLTNNGCGTFSMFAPAWSPDGTRVAFYNDCDASIYLINADGSGLVRLANTSGQFPPAWRPR